LLWVSLMWGSRGREKIYLPTSLIQMEMFGPIGCLHDRPCFFHQVLRSLKSLQLSESIDENYQKVM
jgi:hypothetical protein